MSTAGIQIRLCIDAAEVCPVAAAASESGGTATDVTWTDGRGVAGEEGGTDEAVVIEEFELSGGDGAALPESVETVFETASTTRVRTERSTRSPCICELVEEHGCPVANLTAEDGTLRLTFYATDVDTVEAVLADLNESYDGVRIDRVARTGGDRDGDLVVVDRGALTDRQREVLSTAYEMGYFARPRESNGTEVAEALDISPSTFAEHLAAAQSKVLGSLLERKSSEESVTETSPDRQNL